MQNPKKKKLDNAFTLPELSYHTTPDGFIKIKSFDKLREFTFDNLKYYIAPDMTNGAYLTINRLNTFDYLPSEKDNISLDYIKDLLYEDVPGDIVEKTEFDTPFPGISILNKTKKGDYQKYHIYKTPLEIIIVKFGGKQDFVLKYENIIFDSIRFKPETSGYINFTDPLEKYAFQFPEYHITDNLTNPGKKIVQGVVGTDYYFFQEAPNHDLKYIEEDDFEAKFIHSNFYKELDIEGFEGHFNNKIYSSYESSAEIDSVAHKNLWLKSIVKDGSYYLLGYSGNDKEKAKMFFESFKVNTARYEHFKTVTDTSLLFTVNTITKAPLSYRGFYRRNKKPYDEIEKGSVYTSKSNERIFVNKTKFHDLQMYENADSLWNSIDRRRKLKNNYRKHKSLDISDEKRYAENGSNIYTYKLKDSLSRKEILVKYIQKQGVLFKLTTLTDNAGQPSQFISEFLDTFSPMDSLLGEDIFKDKTPQFFKALKANDSIVLKGYTKLKFKKGHAPDIIEVIKNFDFPKDRENIKTYLAGKLVQIDDSPTTLEFIETLYTESYTKPKIQNRILNSLFLKNTKKANEMALKLMQMDAPLSSKFSKISFYNTASDSLKTLKQLYPDLLQFTSIDEYKKPVYGLLSKLLDSNLIRPKIYKSYKKQIINDAKIEIKRSLSKSLFSNRNNNMLEHYTKLLFPYRKERSAMAFYDKLIESKSEKALTTLYVLLKKEGEPISEALEKETINNDNAQALLIKKLERYGLLNDRIVKLIDLETYAKSELFSDISSEKETDSIVLFEKRNIETDRQKPLTLFIFKRMRVNGHRKRAYLHFIAFETSNNAIYNTKPYYASKKHGLYIGDATTEEEIIENQLILIKHKERKRVRLNREEFEF